MTGMRERLRAELTQEILDVARRHLAEYGADGLSLRAVARDVGMVSSAVYRYFPSRDDLLTALVIEAYDDLGAAVEQADAAVARRRLGARWAAICHAVRDWALANPHQYALIFGTPVAGYAAPQTTIPAGTRVSRVLTDLLLDMERRPAPADRRLAPGARRPASRPLRASIAPLLAYAGGDLAPDLAARGLMARSWLLGAVSVELFGQLVGAADDPAPVFEDQVGRMAEMLGVG